MINIKHVGGLFFVCVVSGHVLWTALLWCVCEQITTIPTCVVDLFQYPDSLSHWCPFHLALVKIVSAWDVMRFDVQ